MSRICILKPRFVVKQVNSSSTVLVVKVTFFNDFRSQTPKLTYLQIDLWCRVGGNIDP